MALRICIITTLLTITASQRHAHRTPLSPNRAYTSVVPQYSAPPAAYKAPTYSPNAAYSGSSSQLSFLGGQPQVDPAQYYQGQPAAAGPSYEGPGSGAPYNTPAYSAPTYKKPTRKYPYKSQAGNSGSRSPLNFKQAPAKAPSHQAGQYESSYDGENYGQSGEGSYNVQSGFLPSYNDAAYKQPSAQIYGVKTSAYKQPSAKAPSYYDDGSSETQTEAGLFYKSQSQEESYSGQSGSVGAYNTPSYNTPSYNAPSYKQISAGYGGKTAAASVYKGQSGNKDVYSASNYKLPAERVPTYYGQNDGAYNVQTEAGSPYSQYAGEYYDGQSGSAASFNSPPYNAPYFKAPADVYSGKTGAASAYKSQSESSEAFNAPAYTQQPAPKAPASYSSQPGLSAYGQSGASAYDAPPAANSPVEFDPNSGSHSSISFTIGSAN